MPILQSMSIVLLGYRGSGKTTVGRLLAGRTGRAFIDTDEQIVRRAGMTIKEIFECDGEQRFRDIESTVLDEVLRESDAVIALGGGAILRPANRQALRRSGHTCIYLAADATTLHARIHADPGTAQNRPALTQLGGGIEEVRKVLQQREGLYQEVMTQKIDVATLSAAQVVDQIVNGKTPSQG